MAISKSRIEQNLQRIRENIAAACARSGRSPQEVRIVAVTKSVDCDTIMNVLDAGLTDLAENRVQQLVDRQLEIAERLGRRRSLPVPQVRWHMIGHLQRNKVKQVLEITHLVHSVDSLRLAEEINDRAEKLNRRADVLLQVNCSQEPQKSGAAVGAAMHLAELLCTMQHLRLVGLMTMASLGDKPDVARPAFSLLREMFDELRFNKVGGADFCQLSMGMSQDYTVAVEEGATLLRIGSALFE